MFITIIASLFHRLRVYYSTCDFLGRGRRFQLDSRAGSRPGSGMSDTKTVWRKVDPPSNDPAALLGRCLSDAELRAVFDAHAADGVLCSRAQVLRAIADLGLPASQAFIDKLAEGDRSGDRKVDWVEFQVLAHERAARASFSAVAHGLAIICCVAMFWYPFYDAIGIPAVQKLIEHWVDGVCWTERRGYSWWKGASTAALCAAQRRCGTIFWAWGSTQQLSWGSTCLTRHSIPVRHSRSVRCTSPREQGWLTRT